jgi:hypothetical protein
VFHHSIIFLEADCWCQSKAQKIAEAKMVKSFVTTPTDQERSLPV